jgi:dCMP deaminase
VPERARDQTLMRRVLLELGEDRVRVARGAERRGRRGRRGSGEEQRRERPSASFSGGSHAGKKPRASGKVKEVWTRAVPTLNGMDAKMAERTRASWDEYFMAIARQVATRSTCDRKHVGAVVVRERMILTTGYNGSIRGLPHCDEVGHLMEDGHCVRTTHAEANALVQAARNGVSVDGADMYVTASPCFGCFKLIANAGLTRIVFGEFYRDERIYEFATELGLDLVHVALQAAP